MQSLFLLSPADDFKTLIIWGLGFIVTIFIAREVFSIKSITANLDKQTEILEKQSKNINALLKIYIAMANKQGFTQIEIDDILNESKEGK